MNLRELKSPIRIYWDINPLSNIPATHYQRIAQEIASNKILSLQITAPTLNHAYLTIIETLKGSAVAIALSVPASALDKEALELLRALPVRLLLASITRQDEFDAVVGLRKETEGRPSVGVSYEVTRANFRGLPDLLTSCIDQKITNLILPMQRLTGDEECFFLSPAERQELTGKLERIDRPAWLKITIHDPFLWRAFFPTVDFPEGGCQAGNTMLYISPEADVYPCPSLPIKIGNLTKSSLKQVIHSNSKNELRRILASAPQGCHACDDQDECKGGCRGRTYRLRNSLDEPDPACR